VKQSEKADLSRHEIGLHSVARERLDLCVPLFP
jgi:hypothetical protein